MVVATVAALGVVLDVVVAVVVQLVVDTIEVRPEYDKKVQKGRLTDTTKGTKKTEITNIFHGVLPNIYNLQIFKTS